MGLNLNSKRSNEDCLKILGDKITPENLNLLADLAQRPGVNEKLNKNKEIIKMAL